MAINSLDLPPAVGLDRSHGPAVNIAADVRAKNPTWSKSDIFIEVAHRLGSFVSYSLVAPSAIRVWTKDRSGYNPGSWPLLINTDESLGQLAGDVLGHAVLGFFPVERIAQ
jgi:hypothetical protein